MIKLYAIRRIGDERIRYVGQTRKTLERRLSEHVKASRVSASLPLYRWLAVHPDHQIALLTDTGSSFQDPAMDREYANQLEVYLIAYFRSIGQADLNVSAGGFNPRPGGWHHSEESRKKISENCAMRDPELAKRAGQKRIGRVISQETRDRISKTKKARMPSREILSERMRKAWQRRKERQ